MAEQFCNPARLSQADEKVALATIRVKRFFAPALAASVIVASLLLLAACSSEKQNPAAPPETVSGVALLTAQRTSVPDYIEATGTVRAVQSAQLASQVMGTITRVNVHEGDSVRRGQVLVTIDEAQPQAAFQSANAGLQASDQAIAAARADYALAEFDHEAVSDTV